MIDSLTDTDLPQVAALLRGLNALHVARVPHRYHDAAGAGALEALLAERLKDGARVLVYRTEGVARGYLLWALRDHGGSALELPRRLAVLDHIAVAPSWRRRGIGRRLVARFEAEARSDGCDGWIVGVHDFNAASLALMRGAGARPAVSLLERRF